MNSKKYMKIDLKTNFLKKDSSDKKLLLNRSNCSFSSGSNNKNKNKNKNKITMYNLIDIDLAELKPKATNFSISKSNSRILNDKRGNSSTSITKTKKISLNSKSINDLSFDNNVQTNKENIIKIDLNSNLNREKSSMKTRK